jgi:hypothetical protein
MLNPEDQEPGERSFTDPLSNLVIFSSINLERHLREILEFDLPLESLPSFLHETTHHWCVISPVGIAEMLLFFRARRAAWKFFMLSNRKDTDVPGPFGHLHDEIRRTSDVLDAVVRYEFTQGLMRPLSEGIALFAEHDASTGAAATVSTPLRLVAMLYARGLAFRKGTNLEKMPLVLAGGRLTMDHIRRKADLMLQPLDCEKGGYLPGYLMVKTLWMFNLLHLECPKFLDSDFFLQFSRSFFYDDWEMVACLLDDTRAGSGALGPIVSRLQERIVAFALGKGRSEEAKRFEQTGQSGRPQIELTSKLLTLSLPYDQIGDDTETSALGKKRLQAVFHELFDTWPSNREEQILVQLDLATLQLAGTVTLVHGELSARRVGDRLIFSGNSMASFSMPAPETIPADWSGTLDIDVVANNHPVGLYIFVTHNSEILLSHSLGKDPVPENVKIPLVQMRRRLELTKLSKSLLQAPLGDEVVGIELAQLIYLDRALANVPDSKLNSIREIMKENGLLPLVGGNLEHLLDAATLSLCAPLHRDPQKLSTVHNWSGGSAIEMLKELNKTFENSLGLKPFAMIDEELIASFI